MADDKKTSSKLSEKDRKDNEDDQQVGTSISGVPKPKDTSKEKSKATAQAENTEEEDEATKKKLDELQIERETSKSVRGKKITGSSGAEIEYVTFKGLEKKLNKLQLGVGDHAKGSLERETSQSARGKQIAGSSRGEIEHAASEGLEEKSGFDLEIDTNVEGLKEGMYAVAHQARKGKAKSDEGKLERLVKNREEYSSGEDEEISESDRKCEMLLKVPLRMMLEIDTEIRVLVEELEELMIDTENHGLAARMKLRGLRAELEALRESNYKEEVELIGMVKGMVGDGTEEELEIDPDADAGESFSGIVGPVVEKARERIGRVTSEMEGVLRNESSVGAACFCGIVEFLLNWIWK